MPANKSQHYVPKFYLKRFSSDAKRRSVSLYNLARQQHVQSASIKNQCARDNFYGPDGELERELSGVEASVAELFRRIDRESKFSASAWDIYLLAGFICLQEARTTRALARTSSFIRQLEERTIENFPQADPTEIRGVTNDKLLSLQGMALFPFILDLKFVLVRNESAAEFITSDHPVIKRNRFRFRGRAVGRGLTSSGLVLILPLGPRTSIVAFDQGVYRALSIDGIVTVRDAATADEINAALMADAEENVFASQAVCREYFEHVHRRIVEERALPLTTVNEFVKARETGLYVRKGDARADPDETELLLQTSEVPQRTNPRLKFLQPRIGAVRCFDDGSAACPMRDQAWYKIADSFMDLVRGNEARLGDLGRYAAAQAIFDAVRPWTRKLIEELAV